MAQRGQSGRFRGGQTRGGQFRGGQSRPGHFRGDARPRTGKTAAADVRASEQASTAARFDSIAAAHRIDESMGFSRVDSGTRTGWLCNMHATVVADDALDGGRAGVDLYFIGGDGPETFKATVVFDPYLFVVTRPGREQDVHDWIGRAFVGMVKAVERTDREDLSMPNHLVGARRRVLKITFTTVADLVAVRRELSVLADRNRSRLDRLDEIGIDTIGAAYSDDEQNDRADGDPSEAIVDVREYDVPYLVRVAIDADVRVGRWYAIDCRSGVTKLTCLHDRLSRPDPVILAFDIETTKLPLKFPDPAIDQIMMISYMIDGQGFLLTNREIVSRDIADFDYTPKPEFDGPFVVLNEPDERAVIERFFEHIKMARPNVIVTYNGDFFDWPFVEARSAVHGIDMYAEIGFRKADEVYRSDYCSHLDAFAWVNRDSYLPQGSRGLKAVTVAKLGYDPDELDPELMTVYAAERPQTLAEYSVSDAVATYYLYLKYVHPFIFSLCTILPLAPDDVLRKGTGTLCEMLLMVQAYERGILLPNKHAPPAEAFWSGHLLESETYVGGHVESIEAGVFRADFDYSFTIDPTAVDELVDGLDAALKFSITVEENKSLDDVLDFDEVKADIIRRLRELKERPSRTEKPLIYHLDVASMYPNIMTTNRLQPDSMVTERDCAACEFNHPAKTCDRRLAWSWRGQFLPAQRDEYNMVRRRLESESINGRPFTSLSGPDQAKLVRQRLTDYSKRVYHRIHDARVIEREAIVCQRENPFYVDTVRTFRDRRYDYKGKQRDWKNKTSALSKAGAPQAEVDEAAKMIVVFDSLQLAHKVILNSFYGYVMRKGSRWYSLSMAGVTCLTGARIIQMARSLVERIGRPLELDTDGIWAILPASFPDGITFRLRDGRKLAISYPCVMLNHLVHARFTNDQYEDVVDGRYVKRAENSIFFELDGPYRAMILPTSKEEGKNLKKRYAVFNHDGSLAELKGFEVKRRGELKLIKVFQTQLFGSFLRGSTLAECYGAVGVVADRWLDVLDHKGRTLSDAEVIDLIAENKNLAKTVAEYGTQKSTSLTTARRLADFLGPDMIKDKGLNCRFVISAQPRGAPVTDRAVPVAIFSAEPEMQRHFLRRWLREEPSSLDLRDIVDWPYYRERLAGVIQKLVTIPAALQQLPNPVPRVPHPDWLGRKRDRMKQLTLPFGPSGAKPTRKTQSSEAEPSPALVDLEDYGRPRLGLDQTRPDQADQADQAGASRKRKASPAPDPFASLPAKMPDIDRDYPGWLQYQKQKWTIQRACRARRRHLFGTRPDVGRLFTRHADVLAGSTWHVIDIRDSAEDTNSTESVGLVRLWAWADGRIVSVAVAVPRVLWLAVPAHSRRLFAELIENEDDNDSDDIVVAPAPGWRLPTGETPDRLFRLDLPEAAYRRHRARFRRLVCAGVRVFETAVPPVVRAVVALGNRCRVDPSAGAGAVGTGLASAFQLGWLSRADPDPTPYLSDATIAVVFLWHVVVGDREVWAIVSPAGGTIVLSSPGTVSIPSPGRMYDTIRAELGVDNEGDDSNTWLPRPPHLSITAVHHPTAVRAIAAAADALKGALRPSNSVVAVQSATPGRVSSSLLALRDVPVITLPADLPLPFPALGWAAVAIDRAVRAYFAADAGIGTVIGLGRFGSVPVGNVTDPTAVIDYNYARSLVEARMVSWWADGTAERDDVISAVDNQPRPDANTAGSHVTVCVDLAIRNLAAGALLGWAVEPDDRVSAAAVIGDGLDDDAAFSTAASTALRETIRRWWTVAGDVSDVNDATATAADTLVQHLGHWAESRQSRLFDCRLGRVVRSITRAGLNHLLTQFRRVGASIVHASETRVVVDTAKRRPDNAAAFVDYVLAAVAEQPALRFVVVEPVRWWDVIAWLDSRNYGGVEWSREMETPSQDDQPNLQSAWQLADVLPPAVRTVFSDWATRFVLVLHQRKTASDPATDTALTSFRALTTLPDEATLPKRFTKGLTNVVAELVKSQAIEMLHPQLASDWTFRTVPGAPPIRDPPTLMLVKSIMQVVSLDRAVAASARLLRRNLLALCHVRDFSAEARWANPVPRCAVEVRCHHCGLPVSLDLCRDRLESGPSRWGCPGCDASVPAAAVERALVADAVAGPVRWSVSDVKCRKCGRGRVSEFAEVCVCAGEWVVVDAAGQAEPDAAGGTDVGNADHVARLRIWDAVASAYNFDMLAAVVAELRAG